MINAIFEKFKYIFVAMIRLIDIIISFFSILIGIPVLILIIIILFIFQGTPIFFKQKRMGKNGKPFIIYKFRTMRVGQEDKRGLTKGFHDKRITTIGIFLRKYKLDELPQFYNILKGDMSVVGSRPQVPYYTTKFKNFYNIILKEKPGLVSPAVFAYGNELELLDKAADPIAYFEEVLIPAKCRLDMELVKNFTLKTYLKSLLNFVLINYKKMSLRK